MMRAPMLGAMTAGPMKGAFDDGAGPTPDPTLSALKAAAVSLWTLDEPTGDFIDLIGSNDLSAIGAINRIAGKVGNSSQTGGGYLSGNSTGIFVAGQSRWVSAWLRFGATGHQGCFGNLEIADGGLGVRTGYDSDLSFNARSPLGRDEVNSGAISAETWVHMIGVLDIENSRIGICLNNEAFTWKAYTHGLGDYAGAWQVHNLPGAAGPSSSIVDEPGVYAGVPTPEMIAALYNGGSGISNSTIAAA